MLFFSKKLLTPDNTMCSNILLRTEVKDIEFSVIACNAGAATRPERWLTAPEIVFCDNAKYSSRGCYTHYYSLLTHSKQNSLLVSKLLLAPLYT